MSVGVKYPKQQKVVGTIVPALGVIDRSDNRLFVITDNDAIGILSTTTELRTGSVSLKPYDQDLGYFFGMAVDEGMHRLILSSAKGGVVLGTRAPYVRQ